MTRRWVAVIVGLLGSSGCYRPHTEGDCEIHCDRFAEDPLCPGSLTCGDDGLCFAGAQQCGARFDAAPIADAYVNPDGMTCYGVGLFTYCVDPATVPLTASPEGALDTEQCSLIVQQVNGPNACVIVAADISITATLAPKGDYPLVLVATHDLLVQAPIDVSGGGAGAKTGVCNAQASAAPQASAITAAAGGSGGSRGGTGGAGGGIDNGSSTLRQNPVSSTIVSGGCEGGDGGDDDDDTGGGKGGAPGGAVYLIAGHHMTVASRVLANGTGGGPGLSLNAGGGGGGSGGLIGLDAPDILLASSALLHAAGGGGGGGAATEVGPGMAGHDPVPAVPNLSAKGGPGAVVTSIGGDGSSGANLDGASGGTGAPSTRGGADPGAKGSGGGGGGGSAGVIRLFGDPIPQIVSGAKVVPSPT